MSILTTKRVISKLSDKLFCYAKQRNMLFIVHNPEAKNFFFSNWAQSIVSL